MAISRITHGPWTGGVDYSAPGESLRPDTLQSMQDAYFGPSGEVIKRNGYDEYITGAFSGTPAVTAIGEHRFSSSATRKFAIAGAVFYEDVSGTWTDRTGAVTITSGQDNKWSCVSADGTLFGTNGVDGFFKWTTVGANIAAATVSGRFTWAKYNAFWDGRLWYFSTSSGEDEAWWSDAFSFETIGANNVHNIDGPTTAAIPFGLMLTHHTKDGIWGYVPLSGGTLAYSKQKRVSGIGSQSHYATVVDPYSRMYFVREDGIYEWELSGQPVKISQKLDGSRFWANVNGSRIGYSWAMVYPIKNWIIFAIPYGSAQTTNNYFVIWDYLYRRWAGPFQNFTRNCGAYFDYLPHMGSYAGLVWKHDSGTSDNGAAINWRAKTASVAPTGLVNQHRWLFARHEFDRQSVDATMYITQRAEDVVSNTDSIASQDSSDALVTAFTIGTSTIAGGSGTVAIDTELWGWSCSCELEYRNDAASVPVTLRKVECVFEEVTEDIPRMKFEPGVVA